MPISGLIYFIALFLVPSPECSGECIGSLSYGFGFISAPIIGVICYIPIVIQLISIKLKKQKYLVSIFVIIILFLIFKYVITDINNTIKTNSIEDTMDFDVVNITYDYKKDIPVFDNEKIKYYEYTI